MSVKTWLRYLISISIIIFAAIAFNCSNDQQSAQESQEKNKIYYTGDTLKTERFNTIITSIKTRNQIGGIFSASPSEGAIYVAVQYKYKNVSNNSIGMFSSTPSVYLYDGNNNKYEADANASPKFAVEVGDNEKIVSDLNPGISVNASTVFEVSKDLYKQAGWRLSVIVDDHYFIVNVNKPVVKKQNKENLSLSYENCRYIKDCLNLMSSSLNDIDSSGLTPLTINRIINFTFPKIQENVAIIDSSIPDGEFKGCIKAARTSLLVVCYFTVEKYGLMSDSEDTPEAQELKTKFIEKYKMENMDKSERADYVLRIFKTFFMTASNVSVKECSNSAGQNE